MINLENAEILKFINKRNVINNLNQNNLKYINGSFSNYNTTYLTLAGIMNLDYPVTEKSSKYKNRKYFYPTMLYQDTYPIPLAQILEDLNVNFIWIGNAWGPCVQWIRQPWECKHNNLVKNMMRLGSTIFFNTPIKIIFEQFIPSLDKSQRVIVDFVNNHTHLIDKSRSNFVFMHHRAPKAPYEKNRDCKDQRFINGYKGYQESYFCTLKEIDYFMEYIRKNDPDAIVVFQADHGQKSEILFDGSPVNKEVVLLDSSIFNAIKFPKHCYKDHQIALTNVNTIRFVLNCAYDLNIEYEENIFYYAFYEHEKDYGIVIKSRSQ